MSSFDKFDILSVSERAFKAKASGKYVVNGSSGTLYDENGEVVSYKEANKYLTENFAKFLGYSSQDGSEKYKDGVLKWLFEDKLSLLKNRKIVSVCASSGGSEALFLTFKTLTKDHTLLLPSIRWPNYDTIAEMANINFETFNRFNFQNKFDFDALKEKITSIEGKILLVINDPCHNPTGYNFSSDEYDELFKIINKNDNKIALLLDLAYLDYSHSRSMVIEKIINSDFKNPLFLAISASKSFGYYGLRMGALITITNKESEDHYLANYKKIIRGTISSTNHLASGGLSLFFENDNDIKIVKRKILEQTERVYKIGTEICKILDEKNIKYYPYSSGFYITLIKENAEEYLEELENKNIFFTLMSKNEIRIAVCSIKLSDLKYLRENL